MGTEDRRDNLRLAAYIHQDADIRDQAGIRLVESFAPEEACKLFELAVDKKFPDKARIAAGLKWVGIHTAAGDYSPLHNQRNITELPSAVREVIKASFETAVLNFAEKTRDAATLLDDLKNFNQLTKGTREKIEEKIVSIMVDAGQYENLINYSRDSTKSRHFRKTAKENITAAADVVVGYIRRDMLIEVSKNRNVAKDTRINAANEAIKICAREGGGARTQILYDMTTSWFSLPFKQVRTDAGNEYVKLCIEQGKYSQIKYLATWGFWNFVPKSVRVAAKQGIADAVTNFINNAVEKKDYTALLKLKDEIHRLAPELTYSIDSRLEDITVMAITSQNCWNIATNPNVPFEARKQAGMKYVKEIIGDNPLSQLESIALIILEQNLARMITDQFVDPVIRRIVKKLMKIYAENVEKLLKLAKNNNAPEKTRIDAGIRAIIILKPGENTKELLKLLDVCSEVPAKLAERINAIAIERARSVTSLPGEGVVSQGTIKPPGAPTTQGKGKITTG